jgi:hypothetical protein
MKEWSEEFFVPVNDAKISDRDIIGSLLSTRVEHARQPSAKKKKKKEEGHNIEIDEEDPFEENGSGSPARGGGGELLWVGNPPTD